MVDENANHKLDEIVFFLHHAKSDSLEDRVESDGKDKDERSDIDTAHCVRYFQVVSVMMMPVMARCDGCDLLFRMNVAAGVGQRRGRRLQLLFFCFISW